MTQDGDGTITRQFRALLANVADMVTISDRDGSIIYASPATRNVSGYTPQEFMRRVSVRLDPLRRQASLR